MIAIEKELLTLNEDKCQGHPTDRFGKLSVRKALNPLKFSKWNLHLEYMGNLRLSVFGLIKMSFRVPKKGELRFSERK